MLNLSDYEQNGSDCKLFISRCKHFVSNCDHLDTYCDHLVTKSSMSCFTYTNQHFRYIAECRNRYKMGRFRGNGA